jgi:response regulator RpfG family c-di-GMP phosphodiesterase
MMAENLATRSGARPRVLCVDDDQAVLDGLARQLYRDFEVVGTVSGQEALALLAKEPAFPVLMCDMRMPELDGTALLAQARLVQPDTVRVLLTGQADMGDAVGAVNEGNIFRFLVKPCQRSVMIKALTDAVGQYRMVTAERELLQKTLRGSVEALLQTLSLANPLAFARAARIQQTVRQMVHATGHEEAWHIEVAAMVSQIGTVVLAPETLYKLNSGLALTAQEELQVRVLPWHAQSLIENIPRLEIVRQIIRDQVVPYEGTALARGAEPDDPDAESAEVGAQMLRVAVDLEALEVKGLARRVALETLKRRTGSYDPDFIDVLLAAAEPGEGGQNVLPMNADDLCEGMTIVQDVTDNAGRLLVGRGYEVTSSLIERIHNWKTASGVAEPIYVRSHSEDIAQMTLD